MLRLLQLALLLLALLLLLLLLLLLSPLLLLLLLLLHLLLLCAARFTAPDPKMVAYAPDRDPHRHFPPDRSCEMPVSRSER